MCRKLLLVLALLLAGPAHLGAQTAAQPFPSWQADAALPDGAARPIFAGEVRSHAGTGLLVGAIVGAAATGLFLVGFCSDPDSACGADEVGRAVIIIGLPPAALGALIGSLIRTER